VKDQFKIYNKKYKMFLNKSTQKYSNLREEVNAGQSSTTKWRTKKYSNWNPISNCLKVLKINKPRQMTYLEYIIKKMIYT
jgi:hypothetical protein